MQNTIKILVDLKKEMYRFDQAQQGDDVILDITLLENGVAKDLTGETVELIYINANNTIASVTGDKVVVSGNNVKITCPRDCTRSYGIAKFQLKIVSTYQVSTFPIALTIVPSVDQNQQISQNISTILEDLTAKNIECGETLESLKTWISTGNLLNADLESNIGTGTLLNTDLEDNITTVTQLKTVLSNTINTGDTLNTALGDIISVGNTLDATLKSDTETANTAATNLQNVIATADTTTYATQGQVAEIDSQLAEMEQQKATKEELNSLGQLQLNGTYTTLSDLQTAFPTGATGLYLVTADGWTYRWNSSAWVQASQFQSTGIADKSVTIGKVEDLVGLNMYPFHSKAIIHSTKSTALAIKNAVKDIRLLNADKKKQYTMAVLQRNVSNVWKVDIYDCIGDTFGTCIARFISTGYTEPSGVTEIALSEYNSSGITGTMLIDWTQITAGTYSSLIWSKAGLDIRAYSLFADKSVAKSKLDDLITNYSYPFYDRATLHTSKASALAIKNAIKDIKLFGADKTKNYCIANICKNYSGLYRVDIWEVDANTDTVTQSVCRFSVKPYVPLSNIEELELVEMNGSKITGKVLIDWSALPDNTNYTTSVLKYSTTGLSTKTYIDLSEPIPVPEYIDILLPPKIYGIVGKEINIYFDNIILCNNINNYQVDVICNVGKHQNERWAFTPSSSGTYDLTINIYKDYTELIATATTSVVIKASTVGSGITKSAIVLGDSTVNAGVTTQEMLNLFASDVMDITLLGTRGTTPNLHEGRNGWTANDYLTIASEGSFINAFWDGTKFNFPYYMAQQGYTSLDYFFINLGINDATEAVTDADFDTVMTRFQTIIDSVKAYNSAIKIGVCVTIPPSAYQDAFGVLGSGNPRFTQKLKQFKMAKKAIEYFTGKESEGIYLVPINTNLDTINNMQTETVAVNSRNTKQIVRQKNNVHPADCGYYQIADVYYYFIKSFEV